MTPSLFRTEFETEVNAFIKGLSKRSTVQGVSLTPDNKIVLIWDTDEYDTGLSVPVDWPPSMVKAGKLPPKVYKASERPKPVNIPVKVENAPQGNVERNSTPVALLDEKGLREAVEKGVKIEYQGIHPIWVPFNPRQDKWVEGYFYRKSEKKSVAESKTAA